jgi:hypothetical protein
LVKHVAGFSLPASSRRKTSMFHDFIGKPSTSEGLSLKEAERVSIYNYPSKIDFYGKGEAV